MTVQTIARDVSLATALLNPQQGDPMKPAKQPTSDADTLELSPTMLKNASASPASTQVKVEIAGATNVGKVRKNNEDHYLALRVQRSLETVCTNLEDNKVDQRFEEVGYGLLVADGMGGMAAGEVASRMALSKLVELIVNTPDWVMKFNQRADETIVLQRITQRFRQVNEALKDEAEQNSSMAGMGTTLTVALSFGATLLIGHIGDSRAYVMRGDKLHQMTSDDTLDQALILAGLAEPDTDATKAVRHVLTAALGAATDRPDPQVVSFKLSHNDQVLLCTDGLTEMVSSQAIASVLSKADSSQDACQSLIDLALEGGGKDNVTVLLARYEFPS
jgi:serine/threonine protein phosphatase PrpC